jgi:hypothetical protein
VHDGQEDRLDDVVLAWLLVPRKAQRVDALARALKPLADGDAERAGRLAREGLNRIQARGLLEGGRGLKLSDGGRARAKAVIGCEDLPRSADWRWVKKALALGALGLSLTAATLKNAGQAGWLAARVLSVHHRLGLPDDATLAEVVDALAWRARGSDARERFDLEAVFARLCAAAAAQAAGEVGRGDFARRVLDAARAARTGRWHDKKVFISHVWQSLRARGDGDGMTFADFQRRLIEAHQDRQVSLERADLVEAMPPEDVSASETAYLNATFHFVRIDTP